jgi:hypothetical protein
MNLKRLKLSELGIFSRNIEEKKTGLSYLCRIEAMQTGFV